MRSLLTLSGSLALGLAFGLALPAQERKPIVIVKKPVTSKPVTSKTTQEKEKSGQDKKKVVAEKDPKKEAGKVDPKTGVAKTAGKKGKAAAGKAEEKAEEKVEEKVEEIPIPQGADPADIKAIRSANAMLEAERKLAELLKSGKLKGIDMVLPFEEIASWPYEDGLKGMPKKLKKLDGKKVMMTGFMLPIDEVENIKEFLLVQSLWSCCYGQPPDINGTVRVVMKGKERLDYKFDPIKIVGKFIIKPTIEDGFCVDVYQLETDKVEVIK